VKRDRFRAEAAAVDYHDIILSLQSALARQYFAYRAADTELTLLRTIHQRETEKLKLVEARVTFGQAVKSDLARATIALQETGVAVEGAERNSGKMLHAIAVLTGSLPSELGRLTDSRIELAPADIPAGLPSELLGQRPDLISADRKLRAAATQVGVRRADFLPKITLLGSGGIASLKAGSLFDADSVFFDIGPQIDIPIFQGSVSRSAIAQARAQFREAAANYRSTFLTAVREVDDALLDAKSYAREIAQQRAATASALEAADAAKDRHETGIGSYADYLNAEQTRLRSVIRENAVTSEQRLASIRLIQALGGSWEN
jgi:multidrug efflux system outer membrane protein